MVQPNPAQGLLSPCHQSPLIGARQDGRPVGCCEECGQPVTRIHEPTNTEEWLDGHPPNTPRALRPVNRRIH